MHIIDRRLNASGKNLPNRQRFLRRARAQVQRAVHDATRQRDIKDVDGSGEIVIPIDGIYEPAFRRAEIGGLHERVLPGNREFLEGDRIERPERDEGEGGGSEGTPDGGGEDLFRFILSRQEFLDIFLDDLELPDLAKRRTGLIVGTTPRRAGFSVSGSPANLALGRTMRNALTRRIALGRPKSEEIGRLEEELATAEGLHDDTRARTLSEELDVLRLRTRRVPFIDPVDLRYRRFEATPKPVAQAVMFCLMDVSGSMTEHMKDLAKRFFILLYIFLTRRYEHVQVVFIRHTHEAKEVDEETFFRSAETGGTIVSSALIEMKRIIAERFDPQEWNIYAAQASDGDNSSSDADTTADLIATAILPVCQHFAYVEVGADNPAPTGFMPHRTALWRTYEALAQEGVEIAMRKVTHRREIYTVFRDLFRRKTPAEAEAS